mmetsp:Transcript_26256/g.40082  ORF Transcript_26256/g.40082 Transcript_26256/m.40082 type:complete len:318 (+) Transcript_26256:1323-2276(+)
MEATLRVVRFQSNLHSVLDIANHAKKTDDTTVVVRFSVEAEGLLEHALSLKVLGPPTEELRLSLPLNEVLKTVEVSEIAEHARNLNTVSITLNEVADGVIDLTDALEVLGKLIVGVFEVDSVVLLSYLDGLIPFTTSLMQLAQKVVSSALSVEFLGIIDHVQLDCNHSDTGLGFLLLLCFASSLSSPDEAHVTEADLGDIESLGLDAHLCHVLPDCVVLDVTHAVVGLVHVADGEEEAEVHDGSLDVITHGLKSDEVLHGLAKDDHVAGALLLSLLLFLFFVFDLTAHEVEEGDLDTEHGLVTLLEVDGGLLLDLEV